MSLSLLLLSLPTQDLLNSCSLSCSSLYVQVPTLLYSTKKYLMLSLLPVLRGRRVGSAGPPPSWMTNALVSIVLSLVVGGLSLLLDYGSLEYVVVLLGSTTSTLLVVVCPAMFYLKLHGLCARDAYGRVASFGTGRFVACVLLLIGAVSGPVCLVGSIVYWNGEKVSAV